MTNFLPITPMPASPAFKGPGQPPPDFPDDAMRGAAQKLEASFLAELLKATGLGKPPEGFSGGIGEEQFASFQRQALADAMVKSGGIGLAETFYQAMLEKRT